MSDMTNEVAIRLLQTARDKAESAGLREAIDRGIKALEQEPTKIDCKHTDCNNCVNHKYCDYESTTKNDLGVDCISRADALYCLTGSIELNPNDMPALKTYLDGVNKRINALPTVYQKSDKPSGKWIYDGHHLRCSNCNDYHAIKDSDWNLIASNYCPNCGAKMVDEQGENT